MARNLWRLLLACLLIVVLPVKGYAATSMVACGPSHHASQAVAEHATAAGSNHATPGHDHQVMDEGAGHHAQSATQDGSHATKASATKCGTCAPCCMSVAPPSGDAAPLPLIEQPLVDDAVASPFSSAETLGLDRPPRSILA